MSISTFTIRIESKSEVSPGVFVINAKTTPHIDFHAGQYLSFRIADKINRSYSIASAPQDETIEFLVDIRPGGPGSQFVDHLIPGSEFSGLGPLGFFTLEKAGLAEDQDSPLVFLATGTGIAPFRSIILDQLKNKKSSRPITLYFGLRYRHEAYLFDEFEKLDELFENFHFVPVLSRPDEQWVKTSGHCQDTLLQKPVEENFKIFICGQASNVSAITEDLLHHGYAREQLHFEKF